MCNNIKGTIPHTIILSYSSQLSARNFTTQVIMTTKVLFFMAMKFECKYPFERALIKWKSRCLLACQVCLGNVMCPDSASGPNVSNPTTIPPFFLPPRHAANVSLCKSVLNFIYT